MELTWTKVLAGAFVLSSGVAAGVWELRGDRIEELESKISSYEAAEKWQLPQLLTSINSANDSIKTNLQRLSDYESAKKRVEELEDTIIVGEKKISELQGSVETHKRELETIKSTLAEKQKFIDELYPHNTTFTLDEGTRKSLVGSKLILGRL